MAYCTDTDTVETLGRQAQELIQSDYFDNVGVRKVWMTYCAVSKLPIRIANASGSGHKLPCFTAQTLVYTVGESYSFIMYIRILHGVLEKVVNLDNFNLVK